METLHTKTIIYDNNCPLCTWYTNKFVEAGAIQKAGRLAFEEVSTATFCKLDMNRARHEIPMIDEANGEVLYGLDGLTVIIAKLFPFFKKLVTNAVFKKMLSPLYHFISYNRRVIAGSSSYTNFAPDFSLGWRLALIITGVAYTGLCILTFALLMGLNPLLLFAFVLLYFFMLMAGDISFNKTRVQQWDYLGHLATLGIIEGTLFVFTALLARVTGLDGLMFAGQGAGRLFATWLHCKRVQNSNYSPKLNYIFAAGAVGLILIIALLKN